MCGDGKEAYRGKMPLMVPVEKNELGLFSVPETIESKIRILPFGSKGYERW